MTSLFKRTECNFSSDSIKNCGGFLVNLENSSCNFSFSCSFPFSIEFTDTGTIPKGM